MCVIMKLLAVQVMLSGYHPHLYTYTAVPYKYGESNVNKNDKLVLVSTNTIM